MLGDLTSVFYIFVEASEDLTLLHLSRQLALILAVISLLSFIVSSILRLLFGAQRLHVVVPNEAAHERVTVVNLDIASEAPHYEAALFAIEYLRDLRCR